MTAEPQISQTRLWLGGSVIVVGFLSPLLIPLVASTNLSLGLKSALSGLLALGIPEVFMIIGVAILGKVGYQFLKDKLFGLLKQYAPPDEVGLTRYRVGLVMLCTPLFFAWAHPFVSQLIPSLKTLPIWCYVVGDVTLVSSFFVLGGNFWDKLRGLFKHNARSINSSA